MNLNTLFKNSIASAPQVPRGYQIDSFLDPYSIYEAEDVHSKALLFKLLAKGEARTTSPWVFDMLPASCCILLYSKKGSGSIRVNSAIHMLPESSLLLFDCNKRYKIQIESNVWEYQIFIIEGSGLSAFLPLLPPEGILVTNVREPSLCYSYLEQLDSLCYQHKLRYRLQIADLIHRLITFCTVYEQASEYNESPEYIDAIRAFLESEYSKEHTLAELEDKFHVSKYRICHEFKERYHMPPLQYLNWRRIEAAKVLLTSTSYKIYEVGNMVGIENTNHFINLFKRYSKLTPLEYKKRMMP